MTTLRKIIMRSCVLELWHHGQALSLLPTSTVDNMDSGWMVRAHPVFKLRCMRITSDGRNSFQASSLRVDDCGVPCFRV